jgi:3-dehydroquinate synthase
MKRTVTVDLGERSYPIHIASASLDRIGELCGELGLGGSALIVSDGNVDPLYGQRCKKALLAAGITVSRAVVPAGETSKCLEQLEGLYDRAVSSGLDRRSFVVALGGGVVGDLAGFLAASYLRGISYVQVPTTIVAMTDSAVGGKTGINLPQGKNLVGSFWQPAAVLVDLDTLETLPRREFVSGLAEVIKYGVIWDADLFDLLEREREPVLARDPALLAELVGRSCEIKADVVRQDEREGGLRAILNYGHTLGHAIEKVASYGEYLHGEAISVGMVYAARLSGVLTGLADADADRIAAMLAAYGLPTGAPECEWPALREAIRVDKKSVGSVPRFVLAECIGAVRFGCEVGEDLLETTWSGMA